MQKKNVFGHFGFTIPLKYCFHFRASRPLPFLCFSFFKRRICGTCFLTKYKSLKMQGISQEEKNILREGKDVFGNIGFKRGIGLLVLEFFLEDLLRSHKPLLPRSQTSVVQRELRASWHCAEETKPRWSMSYREEREPPTFEL